MAVTTRSRAAAQRGLNPTQPSANAVEASNTVRETTVRGAAGSRKPARGKKAKANGAHTPQINTEAGDSASTASRSTAPSGSKAVSRHGNDNEMRMSQPRTTTQTISQTCGLYVKLTFEQVATTSIAGSSSQPLPTSAPEADGAGAKKPRKGRTTMTRRGPKANTETRRTGQRTRETSSTVRAGTKRRREDDEYQPSDDEMDSASVTRKLRRTRRKTEKAAPVDVPNHDDVDEAVNRTRRKKGKARAIDVPTTEEALVGSKRLRDEEDVDTDDVSQLPLDPGPSRRTTRRSRQKVEVPIAGETKGKTTTTRKPRGRRTNVAPRSPITVSRTSTPLSCESEEPTFAPSPAPPTQRREADERPASQGVQPEVLVKQEEVTPPLSLGQPTAGLPAGDPACEREPSDLLSPLMLPEALVSATTPWPFAPPSEEGGSIIKEEEASSPDLDRDISLSPGGSDKENDPTLAWLPQRGWSVPGIEDVPPLCQDSPDESDGDEHSSSGVELGLSENNADLQDGNPLAYHYVVRSGPPDASDDDEYSLAEVEQGPGENNADLQDENPFDYYRVVRTGPRRPLEPLEIVTTFVPEYAVESDEYDTASSDDGELMYPEDVPPSLSAPNVEIETTERRASPLAYNSDNPSEADASLVSTRENLGEPVEIDADQRRASPIACNSDNPNEADANLATRENLGDPQRCSSREVEELLGAPSSPYSIAIPHDADEGATREHESLVPSAAETAARAGSPSRAASGIHENDRSRSPYDESFNRSSAPSPSPFPPDSSLVNYPTPERSFSLPPCQCGNPARHFVVHSDGEASDFSFMGDDEDF